MYNFDDMFKVLDEVLLEAENNVNQCSETGQNPESTLADSQNQCSETGQNLASTLADSQNLATQLDENSPVRSTSQNLATQIVDIHEHYKKKRVQEKEVVEIRNYYENTLIATNKILNKICKYKLATKKNFDSESVNVHAANVITFFNTQNSNTFFEFESVDFPRIFVLSWSIFVNLTWKQETQRIKFKIEDFQNFVDTITDLLKITRNHNIRHRCCQKHFQKPFQLYFRVNQVESLLLSSSDFQRFFYLNIRGMYICIICYP
jgi:hypothetical protein